MEGHCEINDFLSNFTNEICAPEELKIMRISDGILYSVKDSPNSEEFMLSHLNGLIHQLLTLGFLVRGGITKGPFCHPKNFPFGPAMDNAVHLENSIAKSPRIILDKSIQSWGTNPYVYHKNNFLGYRKLWRIDKDGYKFIDFLQPFPNMPGTEVNYAFMQHRMKNVAKLINEGGIPWK